jgi:hypothetical protein
MIVRELMLEHFKFWASDECPPLSEEDRELIAKLAEVVGVSEGVPERVSGAHER